MIFLSGEGESQYASVIGAPRVRQIDQVDEKIKVRIELVEQFSAQCAELTSEFFQEIAAEAKTITDNIQAIIEKMREEQPVQQPEIQIIENTDFEDEMIDEDFVNVDEEEIVRDQHFGDNRKMISEQIINNQSSLMYIERHTKLVEEISIITKKHLAHSYSGQKQSIIEEMVAKLLHNDE